MLYFICSVQHYAKVFWKKLVEAAPNVMGQHDLPKLQCCKISKSWMGLKMVHARNAFSSPLTDELFTSLVKYVPGTRVSS